MAKQSNAEVITGFFSAVNEPDQDACVPVPMPVGEITTKDQLVKFVTHEYTRRASERLPFELQWRLNNNFYQGFQYLDIDTGIGDLTPVAPTFDYQLTNVYNQIAPIIETRLARLTRLSPEVKVIPATADMTDVNNASVATKILRSNYHALRMNEIIHEATAWSELCGTAFFKTTWNNTGGMQVNQNPPIYQGDVRMCAVPPFEIYPENNSTSLDEQHSIIHAKAYNVEDIKAIWNVTLEGREVDVFGMKNSSLHIGGNGYLHSNLYTALSKRPNAEIVLEYYERPSKKYPDGRLIITASDKLLYYGALPYKNKPNGKRGYPFARIVCNERSGAFWGASVVERCIPIQRSYNSVHNRIDEFIARMAVGNLAYEEGSIDEEFLEEGIAPGMAIPYTATYNPPTFLNSGTVPHQLFDRLSTLREEFVNVSGVSEISRNSDVPSGVTATSAIQVLQEQDNTRLSQTADNIQKGVIESCKQQLFLYRQFATSKRISTIIGDNAQGSLLLWDASKITSYNVEFETENELASTPAQQRNLIVELLQYGLFNDPDTGKISREFQPLIIRALKMGSLNATGNIDEKQTNRAKNENIALLTFRTPPEIRDYDNDALHISEHTQFMLSEEYEELATRWPEAAIIMQNHISQHREYKNIKLASEIAQQNEVVNAGMGTYLPMQLSGSPGAPAQQPMPEQAPIE